MTWFNKQVIIGVLKVVVPIVAIISIVGNVQTCSENAKLKKQIQNTDATISKKDSLLSVVLNKDSVPVHEYIINNIPELSSTILKHKVDSLAKLNTFSNGSIDIPKGAYYNKTKFTVSLKAAKATHENDSIAEYVDDRWNLGFNKKSSTFNAEYTGEHEVITGYMGKYKVGGIYLDSPQLTTSNWFNDKSTVIHNSETIYVPEKQKQNKLRLYTTTELRQGIDTKIENISINSATSGHQGIGVGVNLGRHNIAAEGSYKVFGNSVLPSKEIRLKYNFNIIK